MWKRGRWRPRGLLAPALASAAAAYVGAHAIWGTHGFNARAAHEERQAVLTREVAALEAVRLRLRQDVAALASDPPHGDIVEETARATLGWVLPGTLIAARP